MNDMESQEWFYREVYDDEAYASMQSIKKHEWLLENINRITMDELDSFMCIFEPICTYHDDNTTDDQCEKCKFGNMVCPICELDDRIEEYAYQYEQRPTFEELKEKIEKVILIMKEKLRVYKWVKMK